MGSQETIKLYLIPKIFTNLETTGYHAIKLLVLSSERLALTVVKTGDHYFEGAVGANKREKYNGLFK